MSIVKKPIFLPTLPPSKLTVNTEAASVMAALMSGYSSMSNTQSQSPAPRSEARKGFFWEDEPQPAPAPITSETEIHCNESPKRKRGGQFQHDWKLILADLDRFIAVGGTIKDFCNRTGLRERTVFHAMKHFRNR